MGFYLGLKRCFGPP